MSRPVPAAADYQDNAKEISALATGSESDAQRACSVAQLARSRREARSVGDGESSMEASLPFPDLPSSVSLEHRISHVNQGHYR